MNISTSPRPVVVAVDGSGAAVGAAQWAVKEALHHDVPLRLVHVVPLADEITDQPSVRPMEYEFAETCLRTACSAVQLTGAPVHIDTAILHGTAESALIEESTDATLICLGSVGINRMAAAVLGSTAATVAERAHCPVAIIRRPDHRPLSEAGFIAVVLDGRAGSDEPIRWAMEEARVRKAPVLALGTWPRRLSKVGYEQFRRHLDHWLRRYPDVSVEVATTRMSAIHYLESFVGALQLVIISSGPAAQVVKLVGPHTRSLLAHTDCSVLIARAREDAPARVSDRLEAVSDAD